MAAIDECVIFQLSGLGVVQRTSPLPQSTAIMSAFGPAGARISRSPSISGH